MKKNKIIALVIVLILPVSAYLYMRGLSNSAIVLPGKFFYDTILVHNDGSVDTIWHSIASTNLINQFGDTVDIKQLKGKVLVINTFFTSCPSICPQLTASMHQIQQSIIWKNPKNLRKKESAPVHLISLTVDPERDSPAVLKAYANKHKTNDDVWWFLTGDKLQIYNYIINQLKLGVVDGGNIDDAFIHSNKLILVDRDLIVRGFYDGLDSNQVSKLANDAGLLILEK